jgi:putative ABC transport system permease protein
VGVVGALIGTASGYLLVWIGLRAIIATGVLPEGPYPFWTPTVIAPPLVVVLTTWASSWIGSRAVLGVTPLQAVGNSLEAPHERAARRRTGSVIAVILLAIGALLLAGGVVLGLVTPLAMLIALVGGVLSFTGLILGAEVVMPPVLRMIGLLLGSSAPARLAAQNALRHPQRSSRTAIGLVIGVTLVTMFVVAAASYQDVLARAAADRPRLYAGSGMDTVVTATVSVFSVLVGFSALIAAVGMVNNLSLSVMQRSRELGLLRALGFTVGQVRRLVLAESAQIVAASVVSGVVLGVLYGWAGAQSLLGSLPGGGLFAPSVPWMLIVIVFIVATVLATGAAIAPTRRAVTVSPVRALAVE